MVTPVHVNAADYTDAQMLALARYSGRYVNQTDGQLTLGGEGLLGWLGDENDDGDMYVSADAVSGALDLEAQLDGRVFSRANGLTKGNVNQNSNTRDIKRETGTTRRQFLDTICHLYQGGPYEYRVNPDGTLDVDRAGKLWPTASNPSVVLARDGGAGVTVGRSGWLELDGTLDRADTPHSAQWNVTTDDEITILVRVRLDDYSTGSEQVLVSKWNPTGDQRSWYFGVDGTGELVFHWSTNGIADGSATSTGAAFVNGTTYWVTVAFDGNDGANRAAFFEYSTDDTNDYQDVELDQIGSTVTGAIVNINNSTAEPRIGGIHGATLMPTGRIYAVAVIEGTSKDFIVGSTNVIADPIFSRMGLRGDQLETTTPATPGSCKETPTSTSGPATPSPACPASSKSRRWTWRTTGPTSSPATRTPPSPGRRRTPRRQGGWISPATRWSSRRTSRRPLERTSRTIPAAGRPVSARTGTPPGS